MKSVFAVVADTSSAETARGYVFGGANPTVSFAAGRAKRNAQPDNAGKTCFCK